MSRLQTIVAPAGIFMVLTLALPTNAQDAPTKDLKKTDKGYQHAASGTEFRTPDKWRMLEPMPVGEGVSLGMNWTDPPITVTLFWTPLKGVPLSDYVRIKPQGAKLSYGREHDFLKLIYKAEKVGKPEEIKVGARVVYKIPVFDSSRKDGKSLGVVYLFEAGRNPKERWRIKVRAVYPKLRELQNAKQVEALLSNFK